MNNGGDIDYLPIVKPQPVYPRDALRLGLEGYCIIEFDVTRKGSAINNKAIECNPSDIFAPYSVATTKQFFYIPALKNWIPIISKGIQNKITFKIEGRNTVSDKEFISMSISGAN